MADYYRNSKGAIYTARRTIFKSPERRVSWVLAVWLQGGEMWISLPGERPYETVEYANTRLRRLAGMNRWRKLSDYEARKMVSKLDTGRIDYAESSV